MTTHNQPFELNCQDTTPWWRASKPAGPVLVGPETILSAIETIVIDEWVRSTNGWSAGFYGETTEDGCGFILGVSHGSWPVNVQLATRWIRIDETWVEDWRTDDPTILAQRIVDLANDLICHINEIFTGRIDTTFQAA